MKTSQIEIVKRALEKRERILKNWTEEKDRLIQKIAYLREREEWVPAIEAKWSLEYALKRVGSYSARVDYYRWKLDYLTKLGDNKNE